MDSEPTPSDLIAQRIRDLRQGRFTVAKLAARCKEVGMTNLTEQALYKLEGQRSRADRPPRPVSVDEMLTLAYLLDIAPVHLLAGLDDDASLPVTPKLSVDAVTARRWIRGFTGLAEPGGLPGTDLRYYRGSNIPASEVGVHWRTTSTADDLDEVIERSQRRLAELEQIKRNRDEGLERGERIAAELERARRDRDEGIALSPEILADLERIERSQDEGADE